MWRTYGNARSVRYLSALSATRNLDIDAILMYYFAIRQYQLVECEICVFTACKLATFSFAQLLLVARSG